MHHLELAIDLAGSTLQHVRQSDSALIVDLDETSEGAISIVFEAATIAHQTNLIEQFEQLPPWHPARRVTWADVVAGFFCFATESGDSFSLRAQSVRVERRE